MKRHVVVCGGGGGEAWLAVQAWLAAGNHDDIALYCDDPTICTARAQSLGVTAITDRTALFDDPDVATVHLLGGVMARDDLLRGLLERNTRMLVAPPICERTPSATTLVANTGPRQLLDGDPAPHFPPFVEGLRRVHHNHIGRLQQVRMRSLIAGRGGWDPGLNPNCPLRESAPVPPLPALLRRELASKLPLAEAVLGSVVEIQVQAPRREPPLSAIVTWRHEAPARHGILEITVAPTMVLRSPFAARDDTVEITGTAGILWVGRFQGGLALTPSLRIYRGATLIEPEPPTGGWPEAWQRMLARPSSLQPAQVTHHLACLDAAERSLQTGERVEVLPT